MPLFTLQFTAYHRVKGHISRLVHGMKWIYLPMNSSRNSESNLPQKYVSFKRRTRNYRKRRPTITFIPPKVNAFSANGTIAVFILTTEASIGISRLPIIRLIHFRQKSAGHILTMRFRYGMCIFTGININKLLKFITGNSSLKI